MATPTQDQIRARAYQLWKAAGKPEGREDEFWYQAERELRSDPSNNPDEKSDTFLE
jgi:Protein of unknown function (DUF2934)